VPASVPISTDDVIIPSGLQTYPVISEVASAGSLLVESGATLTVNAAFTVSQGNITLESAANDATASLVIGTGGSVNGNILAERYMAANQWHMVSSPVPGERGTGQTVGNLITNNPIIAVNNNNYAMMDFSEYANAWNSFYTASSEAKIDPAKGFSIRTTTNAAILFAGSPVALTNDTLRSNVTRSRAGWNLVGNPFMSSLYVNDGDRWFSSGQPV
jgi:hypothetical protein